MPFRVFLCCSPEHVIGGPILSAHIALSRLVATWHQVNGGGSLMGILRGFEVSSAPDSTTSCYSSYHELDDVYTSYGRLQEFLSAPYASHQHTKCLARLLEIVGDGL